MNLYKWLWSRIGGRPYTYIYRDIYRKYEYFIQLQWFWTGVAVYWYMGYSTPFKAILVFWVVYTFGYINGHFFYGTKIREGQKGK